MLRFLKRAGLEFAWLAGRFAFFFDDSANGNWTYTYDDFNRLIGGIRTAARRCMTASGIAGSKTCAGGKS